MEQVKIRLATSRDKALYNATVKHHSLKNHVNLHGQREPEWFTQVTQKPMYCKSVDCVCDGCFYDCEVFVVEQLTTIGFFTVIYDEDEAEIEFCVTPENLGENFGNQILKLGILYTQRLNSSITHFRANCVNDASEKLLTRNGFNKEICGDYYFYIS